MTNRILKAAIIAAVLGGIPAANAFAASGNTSTAAGTVAGTVVAPIVLTHTAGSALNFGKFTVSTGGSVVVTAAGVGSTTGNVNFVPGSAVSADAFTVTGDNARSFSVVTTNSTIAFGAKTIAFTTTPTAATLTTSAAGTAAFKVGGTLTLTGAETPGTYNGTYNATVTYN
jgi:hypothetical protein